MASYRFTNESNPINRLFIAPGGSAPNVGILFRRGVPVIVQDVRLVNACKATPGMTFTTG